MMDHRLVEAGVREGHAHDPDNEFVGTVTVPWFGKLTDVEVIFRLDDNCTVPTDKQIEAFCQLLPPNSSCFADLPLALLQHYNTAREESPLDEETIEQLFPRISAVSELDQMIDLRGILVWYYNDDWSSFIGVMAECTWEEEHGLGIKIADSKPSEIGNQDIVI